MNKIPTPPRRGLPAAAPGIPVPADKRFRRAEPRSGRRRNWRQWWRRAALFGGIAAGLLLVVAWLGSALVDASVLRVSRLEKQGIVRISPAEVDSRLEGLVGQSILRVDLEQYRVRLLESKWVETAELWRVLPSTVQVRIVERTPLALARMRGQMYLVDAAGVIIDSFGPQYRDFDLPIVDGLIRNTTGGVVANPAGIDLIAKLFDELAAHPAWFKRVSQVDVSDPRNAVLLIDGERAELRLGDRHFVERLEKYAQMAPQLVDHPPLEYYELRFGENNWVK